MKQFFKYALPGFLLLSIIVACEKEYETIESIDSRNVTDYIKANNINAVEYGNTGIFYEVITPGTGADLAYSDQVPVLLTIKSLDGTYTSLDTFSYTNRYYDYLGYFNPEGLRIGIKEVLKKSAGALRMIIPSRLAFGRNGNGNVGGNASLDVSVKVLDKSKIREYEDFGIKKYMTANSLTGFTKTSSGIYYKIADAGAGSPIALDSTISVEYTGKYLNGVVFNKTAAGSPISQELGGFIEAWKEIVPLIKQGGSVQLITPSSAAYGLQGDRDNGMPPFSSLDFTLKVTDVAP